MTASTGRRILTVSPQPATAMIDIRQLREDPDRFREQLARKKFACDVDAVLRLDAERRSAISASERARAEQNQANQRIKGLEKGSPEFLEQIQVMKSLSSKARDLEAAAKAADEAFHQAAMSLPNLPATDLPDGKSEDDAKTVHRFGDPESMGEAVPHFELPWFNRLADFERGSKVTGAGFPFMVGDLARLSRALIQFFLEEASRAGFVEMTAPILVNADSATATGQLPDKEGQMYADLNEALYLIPTAEVPVTNFFRDEILDPARLPIRHCACTPCFRREAGSWGAHVRGLNRLHQFDKVEVVVWSHPEASGEAHEALREHSQGLLERLELPYRTQLMAAGDIGFPHFRQYDLEVWAAGQKRWLEVSSVSNFTDFQARRANIRTRDANGKPIVLHTLNGSALALPRILAALLENRQQPDGRVSVPSCLKPWYPGETVGEPNA
ncbi:MAG: serine--tRNA ligase [Opitutales bacterium]